MKKTFLVNPLHGNGEVKTNLKTPLSATWFPFKGRSGNTHPGAVLPFGKLSVCAYSGGYSSGYGNNRVNSGDPIRALYDAKKIAGLSHLHHSGTGFIGYFYNYVLTTVECGTLRPPTLYDLCGEVARPGYYAATAGKDGVRYEGTTSSTAIYHRYTLPKGKNDWRVRVDFSNDGLYANEGAAVMRFDAGEAELTVIDEHTVLSTVTLQGLPLHFCFHCSGGEAQLWVDDQPTDAQALTTSGVGGRRFGCAFSLTAPIGTSCLTISAKSRDKALADNLWARGADFDAVATAADEIWEHTLGAIEIEADERDRGIFYSNLYHTLIKPSDWSGESFYYEDEEFLLDFITLWDIYKTQLPLLFTLYPEISRKLVRTYALLGEHIGCMPNSYGLTKHIMVEANQAKLLAGNLFCDAYYRGVEGVDYPWVFRALNEEMQREDYREFFVTGNAARTTHTLDLAECCGNSAAIARELGLDDIADRLVPHADNWKNAFDPATGVLREDSTYYEGNHWNYAFRPLRDMNARVALCGGKERFAALLDRFFGYTHPESTSTRFEGFNNETDMEAPYAYAYAGRHDRLCEIVREGHTVMFTEGEGGVPGNCDSGGLSACYLWNAIGIFPVTGQDLMLIGAPQFSRVTLHLASGRNFTILREGEGIYVKSATLDGEVLSPLRFGARRMMQGGILRVEMTGKQKDAARE